MVLTARKFNSLVSVQPPVQPIVFAAIDGIAVLVLLDERLVARLLRPARDLVDRIVPGDVLPVIRTGTPHLRLQQATIVDDVLFERSALRTERAAIDRMIGIAFDVDHLRYRVLCFVAERVNDHAATNRAVRTSTARLGRTCDL